MTKHDMTVGELIEKLQEFPEDTIVCTLDIVGYDEKATKEYRRDAYSVCSVTPMVTMYMNYKGDETRGSIVVLE